MFKRLVSFVLTLAILVLPLSGMTLMTAMVASAASPKLYSAPGVSVNIAPYASVHPNDTVTVTYAGIASCETRLEGTSLGTGMTVSFTPKAQSLSDGVYTLVMDMTAADGAHCIETLTFRVDSNAEIALDDATAAVSTFAVDALEFTAGYASSSDGNIDLSAVQSYGDAVQYALRYGSDVTSASSVSGIPYQVFDIDLNGKTSGSVNVYYSGKTKTGERMVVKAYNVRNAKWDVLGGFIGEGYVSENLAVASYNDGGVIHVAAMLDYAFNGSDTMVWSTDPQHYTKFEDLHEYYYQVYQYAAKEYAAGNVGYIVTTGDLVDDVPTASVAPHQWDVCDQAMTYVEDVGMPNGVVSGNHDVGNESANYSLFYEHFPVTRYNNENWYGGSINNNTSHYDLVTIGNVDFIILQLGYALEATDEVIEWANDVLATYRHRTAIVATHKYLNATSAKYSGNAKKIFTSIVDPNPNVKMVICGHDDGSLCLEKTASDGRIVYEILSDYQFVEAEDSEFYANEHWIGSVPSCCGDGYIRLMTVTGETMTSVTYSPITGRYNPYGDRENLTLDLDCGTPDRGFATSVFSAAVIGEQTTATNVDRVTMLTKNGRTSYGSVTYASVPAAPATNEDIAWPSTTYGNAATPSNPYYAHAAKYAPVVNQKVDLLKVAGVGEHPTITKLTNIGGSLNIKADLNKTPYLYYSFAVPQNSSFTFAFLNNTTYAPWLTFLDATKGGTTMNNGADNWNTYSDNGNQYFMNSATGCIDMRKLTKDGAMTWIVNQLNFYNKTGNAATVSYLFFGDAPRSVPSSSAAYGKAATPASGYYAHAALTAPAVEYKVDVLSAVGVTEDLKVTGTAEYAGKAAVDLNKTPYLYYSVSVPEGSNFTFAFYNNSDYTPWLTFLDARKGGDRFSGGTDNWNTAQGAQYVKTSSTGCIDMREVTLDPYGTYLQTTHLRVYNSRGGEVVLHYLFFGSSAPDSDDETAMDTAALTALSAQAAAIDTAQYTTASANVLKQAKALASIANKTDASDVMNTYHTLSKAIGSLSTIKATIDESTLVSVKNYAMTSDQWVCNSTGAALTSSSSFLTVTQHSTGMTLKHSSAATHNWPQARYVGSGNSYTVNPYGGIYAKVDVDCDAGWAVALTVTQDGVTKNVRFNAAMEHGFNDHAYDGMEGTFKGIYDVSEAFVNYGLDPTATFTVSKMVLYVLGGSGSQVRYNHLEIFTGKTTTASNSALKSLAAYARQHTKSLYTSASWSALQTALTNADTTVNTSGKTQPAINLAKHKLQKALDGLELKKGIEASDTLLADDIGAWVAEESGKAKAYRDGNGYTVIENTNGSWAAMQYVYRNSRNTRIANYCLDIDMTVTGYANVLLLWNGEWVSVSEFISDNCVGEDMVAGEYRVKVPLSDIAWFDGYDAVELDGVRVYAVGSTGGNAVTIRRMGVTRYCDHVLSNKLSEYGPAATNTNPYYAYAAKNAPIVADKVDVLEALGLDHPTIKGNSSYGNNILKLTVDLNKTPYFYYSVVIPTGSNFTFAMYNDTAYAPWLSFLDGRQGATTLNAGADVWDAAGGTQYLTQSVTACIDMRKLTNSSDITTWVAKQINFYNNQGDGAIISYMFFGSEAISDGYVEEEEFLKGDVDFDGKASTVDARILLKGMLGLEPITALQKEYGDMDSDGDLDTTDIRVLLTNVLG